MKNKYLYNTAFVTLYLVYFAIARWIIVTFLYEKSLSYFFMIIYTLAGLVALTQFTLDKGIELWTAYKKKRDSAVS